MKVGRSQGNFIPFDIVISVESREEAQALYAIFNHRRNTQLLNNNVDFDIRKAVGEPYRVYEDKEVIARGITCNEFYPPADTLYK